MPNYLSYCGSSIQLSDDPMEARKERDIILNDGLEALKNYRCQVVEAVEALEPIVEEVKVEKVINEEVNNKKVKKNKKGGK